MAQFNWIFDTPNYLPNKNKHGCQMRLGLFVRTIAEQLDEYCQHDWGIIRSKKNHHSCHDLSRKKSSTAKKLDKHLQRINFKAGETESVQIEPFQIAIKGFKDKREYRIFGYVKYNKFHLVYLDPDHEVYKET